jgi:hypothetical protein
VSAPLETRIYRLAGLCALLVLASLIVPRFVPNSDGGFAAGATAVLTLLVMLAAAFVLSLFLLGITVRHYRTLSVVARAAGLGPGVILGLALLGLITFLRY